MKAALVGLRGRAETRRRQLHRLSYCTSTFLEGSSLLDRKRPVATGDHAAVILPRCCQKIKLLLILGFNVQADKISVL